MEFLISRMGAQAILIGKKTTPAASEGSLRGTLAPQETVPESGEAGSQFGSLSIFEEENADYNLGHG
jgi:hypothetical protein